jgi:Ca-activated chloride channel homolog
MFRFAYPWAFILFVPWLYLLWRHFKKRTPYYSLRFGTLSAMKRMPHRSMHTLFLPLFFRFIAAALIIIALARPQIGNITRELTEEGIDIILALDISGSMRAVDFEPNRLEAAIKVAVDFVKGRIGDRIGLVVFAGESFLQCPLTVDYNVLTTIIEQIEIIPEEYDGTAIGLAITNSINRLRDSDAKSKVIILLSDGANNAGDIDPLTAAGFAEKYQMKIYTIAMGKSGRVMMPMPNAFTGGTRMVPVDMEIDDKLLAQIAEKTGAKFFKADSEDKLKSIWDEISEMEQTEIKASQYVDWDERYARWLLPALILLIFAWLLSYTIWRIGP